MKNALRTLLLPLLLAGCVAEIDNLQVREDRHEVVFHAGWAPETKTVLQENGSVWWSPGDEALLYFLNSGEWSGLVRLEMTSTNNEDTPKADFVVNTDELFNQSGLHSLGGISTFYSIFPKSDENYFEYFPDGTMILDYTVPTVQTAVAGSFDHEAFVSYAETNDNNLYFKNLCGGVKFSVSQPGIKEVSFRSGSGYTLSGSFGILYKRGADFASWPSEWVNSGSDEVIIRAPDNSYFEVGKYYYAVMNPTENDGTFIVTYKKDSSKASYVTSEPTSLKRSVFKRLYNKDEGLTFVPFKNEAFLMQSLPDSMQGSDMVNELTEAHFHLSSDHVTEVNLGTEDAPVYFELIGTAVHYYTPKESFNLKNMSGLNPMFCGWSSLAEVDLTGVDVSELTDFSRFFEGTSLESIDLSHFDTSCATNMFQMFDGCKNLKSLDLTSFNTEHVTNMYQMFAECRNLRELDLSSFNTCRCINMSGMFNSCSSLQKLDLAYFDVSSVKEASYMSDLLATHRKHCVIRANEATKELMCSYDAMMPLPALLYYIKWIAPNEDFPPIEDPFADLYKSTDYST